jgi:ribonucleoside-triphosphate reductase (thioredoxin)
MENKLKLTEEINFLDEIANFTFVSKYARYNELYSRRETWNECVGRVEKMHLDKFKKLPKEDLDEIKKAFDFVREKKVVPSMRSMQFGGKAITAHGARMYNCSVRHIDSIRSFAESFYLLLCGCGVGFGITDYFLNRLPNLVEAADKSGTVVPYVVEDDIEGWSDSIEALLLCYFKNTAYTGRKIVFDYSRIRKEGTPLKTGGGKAPGYRGLKKCHQKVKALLDHIIEDLHQSRLKTINAYDILMHCSDAVLSGGIRRAACSVIFDKNDMDMMNAKTYFLVSKHTKFYYDEDTKKYHGKVTVESKKYEVEISEYEVKDLEENKRISWSHIEPQRARSNNSILLLRKETSIEEFLSIIEKTKQFGEPGFVWADHKWQLLNPCFEINFIPVTDDGQCGVQFCNLTSINGVKIKTRENFLDAIKAATIIGTLQASYTNNMKYLSHISKKITDEEALLGVSITGVMDNPEILLNADFQKEGAELSVEINRKWAKKIGINPCARTTCIKPEGTSSLVLGSASGIHPHHARRYFRRIQCNKLDPVFKYIKSINPHMCEESVWSANKTDEIVTFPLEVPKSALVKDDLTAIEHLKYIKLTQENWVNVGSKIDTNKKNITHNVSCTVLVKDSEWIEVVNYIYEHRNCFSAVSLLPYIGDKIYKQAPLEAITTEEDEKRWNDLVKSYKPIDYKKLEEDDDGTQLTQNLACSGGKCELF